MMSNEVYIDGVNVAECKHHLSTDYCEIQLMFQNNNFKLPYGKHLECYLCKNCYFEQLQRKTKECENAIHNWQFSEKLYSEIKTELEQYKKSKQASYESMQREWNNAVNTLRDVDAENEKLKQALEEVEKYCNECNLKADYTACEVLKIINEVLND